METCLKCNELYPGSMNIHVTNPNFNIYKENFHQTQKFPIFECKTKNQQCLECVSFDISTKGIYEHKTQNHLSSFI